MDAAALGRTQPHEHLLCDFHRVVRGYDALLSSEPLAAAELAAVREAGGPTLVEVPNLGIGRDPLALRRLATASGVRIVMGAGWYRGPYYPSLIDRTSVRDLADVIVRELEVGADGTDVRAGIIGELGVDTDHVAAQEERVLRAGARAHRRTGAGITTHSAHYPVGLAQLDILEEEGADLRRVAIGHCDTVAESDYHEAVARRGAFVQFDTVGNARIYPDQMRVTMVLEMIRRGHAERVLLSMDVANRSRLKAFGGHGYGHLLQTFLPQLKAAGVSDEQLQLFCVENPRRLLAG